MTHWPVTNPYGLSDGLIRSKFLIDYFYSTNQRLVYEYFLHRETPKSRPDSNISH